MVESGSMATQLRSMTTLPLLVFLAVVAGTHAGVAQEPTATRIQQAAQEPQNWLTYYGNYGAWSYSPLQQVTRENVAQLVPVWAFPAGGPTNPSLRAGLEAAPLVVDGVLYLAGMQNNVYAVEAATGRRLWNYIYTWPQGDIPGGRGVRGLAAGEGLIFMGTQDARLVALDATTGEEVWNVAIDDVFTCKCAITSAPLYLDGKVVTGIAGGDQPFRGYIKAVDAKTGDLLWTFYTIPAPGEPDSDTWVGDAWKTGGVATWLPGSYDPDLNLIYWGTGNAFPDLVGEGRPGSNLYAASLVALDADTGKLKWYFQETPHDVYDFDSNPEPVLFDAMFGGQLRKLVLHSSKNGFAYLLDRETGAFLKGFPFAATVNWTKGLDANGKPIDPFVPEENATTPLTCPGTAGARNFNHSAYSPRLGWWFTSSTEMCSRIVPGPSLRAGRAPNPDVPPHISAFDPLTGMEQWRFMTKYVNQSSLLVTAGDLIFGGDMDGDAFALDARTGRRLWSFNTGGRIVSPPVAFSVDGRQFVAIGSGGGSIADGQISTYWPETKGHEPQSAATLFVFALPERSR